jgi:hypothetical protein
MRYEVYIRLLGDESIVQALHEETRVPGATVEQLRARKNDTEYWWNWRTPKVSIEGAEVDRGVKTLLDQHRRFFAAIKRRRENGADIYLELVTYYRENEQPAGFYLSAGTVALLNELGAALDHDAVLDVKNGPDRAGM